PPHNPTTGKSDQGIDKHGHASDGDQNTDRSSRLGGIRERSDQRGRTAVPHRKGTGRVVGKPGLEFINRDSEQSHLLAGVRTPGRYWEHRWALSVLNSALGGGLSSRLFQQIRETRGLAYSVYSSVDTFSDSGAFSVYAACLPERFDEVVRVATDVLADVARDGITESECRIAKGSLRGGLVLGLEDSGSRMHRIGRSELNYGAHKTIAQTLKQIDAVTLEEVNSVAKRLLAKPMGAAVLGPHKSKRSLPQRLRALAG
ncbi:M16 family metallopeptidase, partial [Mycolicibacterium diernhoferi]|uniref:M16 family metallopeptidase n=1 Tax=Mycolicibacterium diernhoferi TaxID=1801 RepID=UPI00105677D4